MLLKNLETMEEEKKLKNCRKLFADLDQTTRTIRYDTEKSENDFFLMVKYYIDIVLNIVENI